MRRSSLLAVFAVVAVTFAPSASAHPSWLSVRLAPAVPEPPEVETATITAAVDRDPAPRFSHVLIISEDGMSGDALSTLHLKWHHLLLQHSSYTFKAKTIRDASTLPAHASMLSGVDVSAHGLSWNRWRPTRGFIKVATIFDLAKDAGLSTAFFTGKPKLHHIVPPGSVDKYERPGYLCKKVADEAAAYLIDARPALAFVHFSDPDDKGHSDGWGSQAQIDAIGKSDRCLGILYAALETAGLLDDTLIIVSADHGGHNHVHSGALAIDREIPWIASGPGVRKDFLLTGAVSTMDTAATALYALGLPIPKAFVGKPRMDIFVDRTAKEPAVTR